MGLLLTGCASTQEDEAVCIDYKMVPIERDECIPLYGNIICHRVIKTEAVCIRRLDQDVI